MKTTPRPLPPADSHPGNEFEPSLPKRSAARRTEDLSEVVGECWWLDLDEDGSCASIALFNCMTGENSSSHDCVQVQVPNSTEFGAPPKVPLTITTNTAAYAAVAANI